MIGRIIGNYEIVSQFGEGGMGELYLGRHTRLAREVIIKTIRTEDFSPKQIEHLRDRLEREAFVQSQLDNVNIVRVYDFIASGDTTCMVMEYVPGRDLRKMILRETGPIPASRAIHLFKQVLVAINYAHSFVYSDPAGQKHQGIIHRDLKPANILVTPDDVVKVTDFGIVKLKGVKGGTQLGFNPGTPEYMSPEQALGREIDQRSDIYSLGVVFYEMLTGRVPFEDSGSGTSDYAIRKGHIELPVPPPSQFYPAISPELEKILLKALEKNPDLRFQEARDFYNAIEEYERTGLATGALRASLPRQTVIQRDRRSSSAAGTIVSTLPSTSSELPSRSSSPQPFASGSNDATVPRHDLIPEHEVKTTPKKWLSTPVIVGLSALLVIVVAGILWMTWTPPKPPDDTQPEEVPPGMIRIAGNEFTMGRDDNPEHPYEKPAHKVKVNTFLIDEAEVTNDQYQQFVELRRRQAPAHWVKGHYAIGAALLPVVNVSWYDAKAYCESLNKRLPTEEEWEFAARGTDGRLYPYGNEWRERYSSASETAARPVRSFPEGKSPFGLYDMAGNVLEWTASDFKPYPGSSIQASDDNFGRKVTRGGAFAVDAKYQTVTDRFTYTASSTTDFIGFRCAKDALQQQKTTTQ